MTSNIICDSENKKSSDDGNRNNESQYSLVFVIIYGILLAVCVLISKPDSNIFVNWNEMGAVSITQLVAAIILTFFLPGYAIVQIISKKNRINPVLKVLLAYLLSILISGGIEYISAMYLDHPISETKYLIIGIHLIILLAFLICYPINKIRLSLSKRSYHKNGRFISYLNKQIWPSARSHSSEILVFGSLLALLVVSTYYLFGGITIGDQWFHQGRTILFMSGSIRETALSHADSLYAPFQSAVLATLTALSGIPLVNAYASIAFLNIIPAFGYYYFFSTWMSSNMRRAKIFATTLFAISSGFGWIYLLGLTVTTQPVISQRSVLDTITSMEPFDIFQPTNFFLASHPDFSTGLIYIAIPAGFVMLGILRDKIINKYTFCFLVTIISILGILIHDEFYLFTIVASFIPLIFRIKHGNELYLGLILAYLIVYTIDITGPQNYYTSNELFGLPLLFLSTLFTASTWALYLLRQTLHERLQSISIFFRNPLSKQVRRYWKSSLRTHFLTKIIVISIVGYFYGLSFIVLAQLSTNDIIVQTAGYGKPYNIPWYLYPMKFGITGLIALACILSYLFKRFEKEVFVFGIIGVIALFAGPYYDEHRFSKYIMAGMAGFASILLYKILISLSSNRPVINRTIIAVIITVASVSSLLYIGYNSLIVQTQEYVHSLLSRRNFPTQSEMPLFQLMHDKIDFGSKRYNILTFPKEYDRDRGLMTFFQAFSGLPETKVYEKPLTLNVTTLGAFYHLLDYSGIRYIVIPKDSINERLNLSEPVRFALDHFKHTYENNKYIVLDVPDLKPPSSSFDTDIALIYNPNQQDKVLSSNFSDSKLLKYDNKTFNFGGETNFVIVQDVNKPEKAILADQTNKGITLWSKNIDPSSGINYVQVSFGIIDKNENGNDVAGLKWKEGDTEYYLALSKEGLELSTDSEHTKGNKIVYQNAEVEKKNHAVYDLKLVSLQKSINVFLNDTLRIQLPLNHSTASEGISKVGISESNGIVQLGQIKIGRVPENLSMHSINNNYNNYPLSILALSNSSYGLFTDTDLSSFSKKLMILTSDPESDSTLFNSYLEYAKKGGKVVVMSPGNFKGRFSELFGLQPDDNRTASFTRISNQGNESISVSGMVKKLQMNLSQDINVISDYRNKSNRFVAPFVLEKDFPNGGKILYVNSEGYFNSLSKSPIDYFMSLSKIPALLDLEAGRSTYFNNSEPAKRFIGDLTLDGKAMLKTSSLLLSNSTNNLRDIHAKQIVISDKTGKTRHIYNNVTLAGLKLIGKNEITINSTGKLSLPRMGSQHDYVGISVPPKFNMTVNVFPDKFSSAEINTLNGSIIKTMDINNNSIIDFYEITSARPLDPIALLLKSPDVIVNGQIHFARSNFDPDFNYVDMPLDTEGNVKAKIAFVDDYEQTYENGTTKLQFVTFLQSISLNTTTYDSGITFEPPGDISHHAKQYGPQIPLKEAILSYSNFILLLSICIVSIIGSWLIWPRIKFRTTEDNRNKLG